MEGEQKRAQKKEGRNKKHRWISVGMGGQKSVSALAWWRSFERSERRRRKERSG
jgi:hypothetical protein